MSEYFGDVLSRAMSRRDLLKGALYGSAGIALLSCGGGSGDTQPLTFRTIQPNTEDRITLPEDFNHNVVIRWGDALDSGPNLDWNRIRQSGPTAQDVERQRNCFGYNCDFVGYLKTQDGRHILVVNHEYCNPELMFPEPFITNNAPSAGRPTREESNLMLEAHGLSVVEIRRKSDGSWEYVKGSPYNRRITGSTRCDISGPARGHRLMRTSYDSQGTFVLGTLNNCAAGKTPWGTVLTCEENFHSYFGGNRDNITGEDADLIKSIHRRYGVPSTFADYYGFYKNGHERFNIEREPREAFRFGWVVEVDPFNPNRAPIKRTALGRMKHEAATYAIAPDGRVVFYMGDDERFEYIYKFITKGAFNPNNREANFGLLDEGDLYAAKFNDDLSGQWLLIARVERNADGSFRITPNSSLPDAFKNDPVLCFINTRAAADALGATKMDRPEDIEWNPVTRSAWVALTYNERRGASGQPGVDRANPRANNVMGHILEIREANGNPASVTFTWNIPVLCGDPNASDQNNRLVIYGQPASSSTPAISAPDNFVIDRLGNVWIATDGNPSSVRLRKNDGVYVLNPINKEFKMFLSGVPGCEICGPEFSDDWKTFFCAIQHPGEAEGGSNPNQPSSRWPYGDNVQVPRPSVIAVWRKDGRDIFA
ncbi:MAG: PhoX family phosphatase [Aquificaceae bacterium]|jgi:secreted PhoX family phosphatase|uniref:PhoX family protein n=1 Tax=Hydrogenobacter sp. Uz 6-8 TaxID=3384828 RepID=UPI000F195380|nr:MAG: PhoX family phosphatase [Aquificota bacterium]